MTRQDYEKIADVIASDECWQKCGIEGTFDPAVAEAALERRKQMRIRANEIQRRSLAGGKFYGHPAAFAVYNSAKARISRLPDLN